MGAERLANPAQRAGAWFLDAAFSGLYSAPFLLAMFVVGDFNEQRFDLAAFYGFGIPAWLSFFALLVYFDGSRRGQTPGKMLVGTRVVDEANGTAIGYRRALGRRLVYLLGGLPLYLGWLWCLWDRRNQTWHDKAAGSVVVRTR